MIGIIAAVSQNGVIGTNDNKIPWNYSEDFKFFKQMTLNSTVIMGRKTFESMGNKPLPKRRNIVISSFEFNGVESFFKITDALDSCCDPMPAVAIVDNEGKQIINKEPERNIWFIGGASIYQEAMKYVDVIHLTVVPLYINDKNTIKFPWINPLWFKYEGVFSLEGNNELKHVIYRKII